MAESSAKLRIALGADHAGFQVKESIKRYLESAGHTVDDVGTGSEESVDYPDFAREAAGRVADGKDALGILVCGTGIGMTIAANKVAGIRAALAQDPATARLAREHNNANVLAIAGRVMSGESAVAIVREFLAAEFAGGRHERRVNKISLLDGERKSKS
ncbi:MAG TPA: ribose 5-phosphate isomerase B [Candidatus Acidoferrales bacterium]